MNPECLYCEELVKPSDQYREMPVVNEDFTAELRLVHVECFLRRVVGSVAHQLGKCPCHGGTEHDPENMSKREAAKEAVRLFEQMHMQKPGQA